MRDKAIKGSRLVRLVESYRNENGQPRQRIIASLGNADIPKEEYPYIIQAIEDRLAGQDSLFLGSLSEQAASSVSRIVQTVSRSKLESTRETQAVLDGVLADEVVADNVGSYRPSIVALHAWDQLNLSEILESEGVSNEDPTHIVGADIGRKQRRGQASSGEFRRSQTSSDDGIWPQLWPRSLWSAFCSILRAVYQLAIPSRGKVSSTQWGLPYRR